MTANRHEATSKNEPDFSYQTAGGIRTAYLRAGTGSPLVLIHGGGAGADTWGNWKQTLPQLTGRFDVIAYDMVGFGHSDKPDAAHFTYDQAARERQLEALLEALRVGPVYLVGNSMGGLTALGLAARRPDMVKALVLMGSAAIRTPTNPALQSILNYDFTREGMRRIVQSLTHDKFKVDEEMVDYRHRLSIEPGVRAGYIATQNWIRERGGLYCEESLLQEVTVPTLIVSGKNDKVVPVTSAYRMLELIPQAWGKIFPDCGHWAMIEHPRAFCRAVLQFFEDLAD
jgi:2-hydroxy-6-oxo-6-(2'-aminophenyl)hexa-2,4-dienoate hydrolase